MEKRVDLEKATDYHNSNKIQLIDNHDMIGNSSVQFSHQSVIGGDPHVLLSTFF